MRRESATNSTRRRALPSFVPLAIVAALLIGSPPLSAESDPFPGIEEGKELALGTFVQRTGRVEIVLGAYIAGLEASQDFIPFQVAVGVWDKGPELAITLQDFELHDSAGDVLEATSPADATKNGLNQMIKQWVEMSPLNTGNHFATSHRTASNFYPEASVGTSVVHLDRETYLVDVIYFPRPKAGFSGKMMLSFFTKGMEEGPVNMVFEMPEIKKKHKKKAKKMQDKTAD